MAYIFSPSSLSLLADCPRCFWLQFRKGIKRPSGIFPSLPSGMDKVLKQYYSTYIGKDSLPPELAESGLLPASVRMFSDMELLRFWQDNFKGIQWVDGEGNLFKGAVDSMLVDTANGRLIVLDFKTRGYPLKEDTHEHYRNQLDIYNLLLRKTGRETEDYSLLAFYHPTSVHEKGEVRFKADIVKMKVDTGNAEAIFRRAVEVLKGDMPEPSEGCGFCNWKRMRTNNK